ncbi:MAG TPA: hypothetical protein VFX49_04865 [Chloroflexota bacterium]|nr:hypothetical protein [Chloroflexota bacterium]
MISVRSRRAEAAFYGLLGGLVLALGLARLWLGPWYYTWNPFEVTLLERWPAAWEVAYYTEQFPHFLGAAPPKFGVALVHYRTFATLYLAATLYAWTGSAFWSLAAVDFVFWFLGGVAARQLARRLGATELTARIAALLVVASPLFISHFWRLDLHAANFATMAIGSWAAVALIDGRRNPVLLTAALGALLVWLGLNYSYQWVLMPLLVILCLTSRHHGWAESLLVPAGAALIYLAGTRGLELLFATLVGPASAFDNVASQPGSMILERARSGVPPREILGSLFSPYHVTEIARSYHPLVLGAGIGGALLLSRRLAALTIAGLGISLYSVTSYSAPWAATVAYPFVYVGAAHGCAVCGRLFGRYAVTAALSFAILLMSVTNLDLAGNTGFLLTWWSYFAGRYVF